MVMLRVFQRVLQRATSTEGREDTPYPTILVTDDAMDISVSDLYPRDIVFPRDEANVTDVDLAVPRWLEHLAVFSVKIATLSLVRNHGVLNHD